jgi:multiple sugar transport system permease protein
MRMGPPPNSAHPRPLLMAGASRRAIRSGSARREALAAYAFLSPALILFLVFIAGPLLGAIALSLFEWDLFSPATFVGLQNYRTLLSDPVARTAVTNSFVFTFWSIVLHLGLGLLLALAVNRAMPSVIRYFLRTAFFFPLLISWASGSLIWLYALDPNFGFFNYYLHRLGITSPNWLLAPRWAMPAIIFVDLWRTIGFTFIILLAGLQGVPRHLYEAAMIDGAGPFRRFVNITIPMMSPTLFFATVLTFIGAFQIFEPMFIMTEGGPGNATRSLVLHIFETGFRSFQMGYASAMALIVFLVIMAVTLLQLRLSRYWVHYD